MKEYNEYKKKYKDKFTGKRLILSLQNEF